MPKFKHLTFTDRLKIEALKRERIPIGQIAQHIGKHRSTIYRELQRGKYERMDNLLATHSEYSPDISHNKYREHLKAKGAELKIGNDYAFSQYVEYKIIKEHYSPAAVLGEIKTRGINVQTEISVNTLYSYIANGVFLSLSDKHLLVKGKRKKSYIGKGRPSRPPKGESIEKRPPIIGERTTFGHWEMDSVESGKIGNSALLVLTERKTRREIIRKVDRKNMERTVAELDNLEYIFSTAFSQTFKTITVDNGSEFADCAGMEQSKLHDGQRTKLYYCHPRNPQERGSNENANRLIRRFYPKGTNFDNVSEQEIQELEAWINNYPRKILGYRCAGEMFAKEIEKLE